MKWMFFTISYPSFLFFSFLSFLFFSLLLLHLSLPLSLTLMLSETGCRGASCGCGRVPGFCATPSTTQGLQQGTISHHPLSHDQEQKILLANRRNNKKKERRRGSRRNCICRCSPRKIRKKKEDGQRRKCKGGR
ncbi:hypothetical protein DFH27DRAFT_230166 [Peziza echinospora]|nr:hypothetical protein DFH27DRAFT_230166 [Peziza echinospora]